MDIYVSNYTNKLDAKGRVSIPAPFRAVLARDGFEGLYVHPSLDQEALDCGGHALLREIDGLLSGYTPYSEERDLLSLALMGSSEILKVDFGRAGDPDRNAEKLRGRLQRSHLRRRRPKIPDLGVRPFSRAHGGGQNPRARIHKTARFQSRGGGSAAAITWSTGMNAGRGEESDLAAGGPARHIPVLRDEVLALAAPQEGGLYLDATFGAGGYSRALLATPGARVLALDRDPDAIAAGAALAAEAGGRLLLVEARFSQLIEVAQRLNLGGFDAVLLDIGVSSMQLDDAARGFSFRGDGPLDMRMQQAGPSAADIVNTADEETLADILYYFGEERASRRIARAIVLDRAKTPFTSTAALAGMIARVAPGKPGEIHPATRAFQALRIAVNDELGELVAALAAAERVLKPGGRLVVVTFHSLEDRIVKQFFAERSGRGEAPSRRLPGEIVAAGADLSHRRQAARDAVRRRDRRQSARALGQAPPWRAPERAGASRLRRSSGAGAAAARRQSALREARNGAVSQFPRRLRPRRLGDLRLFDQI